MQEPWPNRSALSAHAVKILAPLVFASTALVAAVDRKVCLHVDLSAAAAAGPRRGHAPALN